MYKKHLPAFSLIELVTVVVISSMLAAMGISSYMKYLRTSRRQEAIQALTEVKTEIEQRIVTGVTSLTIDSLASSLKTLHKVGSNWYSQNEFYIITIEGFSPPNYTIKADARNTTKDQKRDTMCNVMYINQDRNTPISDTGSDCS